MPYKDENDKSLPDYVKELAAKARRQWVAIFNSAYDKCQEEGGKDCESSAFAQANGVVMDKNRVTKTVDGESYPASDFLVVEDSEKPSTWHLQVKKNGKPDHTLMGAAHAALMSPSGYRGNKYEGPNKDKAISDLKKLYKSEDMEWPEDQKNQSVLDYLLDKIRSLFQGQPEPEQRSMSLSRLYQIVAQTLYETDPESWLIDLYSDGPVTFALVTREGKLYRVDVLQNGEDITLAEPVQVTEDFPLVQNAQARVVVTREGDRYRWTLRAATSVLNRVGEIDSTELFDHFVERAKTEGYPDLVFWHEADRLPLGKADFIARDGVVYLASGLFAENNLLADAVRVDMESQPDYWGASIGYEPLKPAELIDVGGVQIPVYRDGINREISLVPEKLAANWFTAAYYQKEVTRAMRKEIEDEIKRLLGDKAEEFIKSVDQTNREVEAGKMITREEPAAEEPKTEPAAEPPAEPEKPIPTEQEVVLDETFVNAVVAKLGDLPQFGELTKAISDLKTELVAALGADKTAITGEITALREKTEKRLTQLEKTDEEKQREWMSNLPADTRIRASYRPKEAHKDDPEQPLDYNAIATQTLAKLHQK